MNRLATHRIGSTRRVAIGLVMAAMVLSACTISTDGADGFFPDDTAVPGDDPLAVDPGDCIVVDMAVSSEKIDLLRDLATEFNQSGNSVSGRCIFVRPVSKSSGGTAQILADGWPNPEIDGPAPVIYSPAGSTWGAVLNQRLADRGESAWAPTNPKSFMQTPLVIAMPEPMAQALGYPDEPIGWRDILDLARNEEGWAAFGHPEWGPFRLGKTNPNFSTSGLAALVAQTYAAAGKVDGLSLEDLANPDVTAFAKDVEGAVVHYGPTTLTFLNNWYRNDARGTALTYASAAAVEEVSIIQYNQGNPDGVLQPGEIPERPRTPLVAIYPEEGTIFSDNPFFILDAPWVDEDEKQAARLFQDFVQLPENQVKVLDFGFRPGNIEVAIGAPIVAANGVDPNQPQTTLEVPSPQVLVALIDGWAETRKAANVLLVIDVSGSMGDPAVDGQRDTKLDLAKSAAINALDQFEPQDSVGLRIFSTEIGPAEHPEYADLVPVGPVRTQREAIATAIRGLIPFQGTPLYTTISRSYDDLLADYDPKKINALVVLTDGRNEDINEDLEGLLATLRRNSEGQASRPVRVFTIGYGQDADLATMRRIAESTNAAAYDASDPASIDKVFTAVVSNF